MFRTIALVLVVALPAMPALAQDSAKDKARSEEPSSGQQLPKNPPPPRSTPSRDPTSSSSRENIIDLSPPPGDRGSHPERPPAADGDVTEMHPYDPHKAEKNIEIGDFYFKRGNYKAAVSRYREALQWKPNDALATFRLAQALEKMSELGEAYTLYQKYVELLPSGPLASQAKTALKRLVPHLQIRQVRPDALRVEKLLDTGKGCLEMKNYYCATQRFDEILQLDLNHPEALFLLGKALEASGESAEARQHYYNYLKLYPQGDHAAQAKAALTRLSTEPHPSSPATSQSAQTPR